MRLLVSILLLLLFVPGYAGPPRLPLLGADRRIDAWPVLLDPAHPARRRVGDLLWLGGVELRGRGAAFGGFSALHVAGGRITLLSDGGNIVSFAFVAGNRVADVRFAELPAGPGTGWEKRDRDSEAMAVDPRTGRIWVGFERANAIWRYAPGFARAEAQAAPPAMRDWPANTGPEAIALLPDGGMLVIAEQAHRPGRRGNAAIRFSGDPALRPRDGYRFGYASPPGYRVSDMALLPDGRLLVLNRGFALPYVFSAKLAVVDMHAIRPGATVAGRVIATLAAPLIHDNFEGVAVTRERGATIVWLVSDDNQSLLQRSLLLKFTLLPAADAPGAPIRRRRSPTASWRRRA